MIELPVAGQEALYALNPSKIICLGLNYHDHIKESRSVMAAGREFKRPNEPVLFNKTPNTLLAPGEAIQLPAIVDEYGYEAPRTDLEAELAIIIGKQGKHISPDAVFDYILGYTCLNDVSQRDIQSADQSGWFRGKSFDTFAPVGPRIVLCADLSDPGNLNIESRINGKTAQQANTSLMIFDIPAIVAFVSRNFTLYPGDIISTGTPAGVSPIKAGDMTEIEIEGIGVLSNPVTTES